MDQPVVSVIVRTKDRPELLMEALASIGKQTCRSVQVVIVNDGGCAVGNLDTALGDIPFILVTHRESMGRSFAMNSAIARCEGEYICFLDDDDLFNDDGIENLLKAALDNPGKPVYGRVRFCEYMVAYDGKRELVSTETMGEPFDFGKLVFDNFIPTNSLMIPSEIVSSTGSFDTAFEIFEDWDWIIRMAASVTPVFVDRVVSEYRSLRESTFSGKGGALYHRKFKLMLLEKHAELISPALILDHVQRSVDTAVLEKQREISGLRDELAGAEIKAGHYCDRSAKLREENEKLREEIGAYQVDLEQWKEDAERNRVELKKFRAHVKWQEDNVNRLGNELASGKDVVAALKDELAAVHCDMGTCRESLEQCMEEKAYMAQRLADTVSILEIQQNSLSWKLTSPLRSLNRNLRFWKIK